jgi:hypothetical protein
MSLGSNKFVVILASVTGVLSLGLGYLIYDQSAKLGELTENYGTQVAELKRLKGLPLFPDQANLEKLEERKQLAEKSVADLTARLASMAYPLEPITPEQLQDKLRATVSAVAASAKEVGVKLPERFYLGFDRYQSEPPKTEATAALNRQLKVVEFVFKTLVENKVAEVSLVDRALLPEEGGAAPAKATTSKVAAPPKQGAAAQKGEAEAPPLFAKFPIDIQFTCEQRAFQQVLNKLTKAEQPFIVVSRLVVKNERETPLSKSDPSLLPPAPVDGSLAQTADPAAPPQAAQDQLRYVVGDEKVIVSMRLEMVVFAGSPPK